MIHIDKCVLLPLVDVTCIVIKWSTSLLVFLTGKCHAVQEALLTSSHTPQHPVVCKSCAMASHAYLGVQGSVPAFISSG